MIKNNNIILHVENLTTTLSLKKGPVNVVENLSFDLNAGQTLALVGESACGKSMTALSIMRILPSPPAQHPSGKIIYQNKNLLSLREKEMRKIRGSRIAMIFQNPMSALNPVYTIGEQLMEVLDLHLREKHAEERIFQTLDDVGIPNPRQTVNEFPHSLSGGMKQRVMIAMAILCEPDILIADEPTTALDVTTQKQVLQLIRELQKKRGTSLLLITHDMGVVAEMADDVVVMYSSRAIEQGSVYEIFDNMLHPYTQGLFLSRPQSKNPKKKLQPITGSVPSLAQRPPGCHFHPRCSYAREVCRSGDVPKSQLSSNNHQTLCWLYHKSINSHLTWE